MGAQTIASEDVRRIEGKLQEVGMVLLAMHRLAICHGNGVDSNTFGTAIESMSKQAFRAIDACIDRLEGTQMGNFSDEFESEDVANV